VNTLTSSILSALQDTRDGGYTIEERAEAIAAAVRAETPEPPTGALGQWIASLRVGDTLTVDDIHRFVRVEMALRNADKHHQQARAMTAERDAIKANYDESVRECANVMAMRENVSSQLWDCMNERDGYRARLAACERVVEAACEWGKRYGWQQDMAYSFAQKELAAAVDEYRAAVAADKEYPADAPHRVVRVALVDEPVSDAYTLPRVTDEMVERVARALHEESENPIQGDARIPWWDASPYWHDKMRRMARAALEVPRDE
jgi:hypothetical protein